MTKASPVRKSTSLRAVEYQEWLEHASRREISPVAYLNIELDALLPFTSVKPKKFTQRATKTLPKIQGRTLFLILSNGVPAELTEYLETVGKIEFSLPVLEEEFVFEDDYQEVLSAFEIDSARVRKFEGNFTWLPNRKAKRVMSDARKAPLVGEWWEMLEANLPPKNK